MRVVLATSPPEDDRHGVRSLPPLSLGYLAACVKKVPGVTVHVLDAYGADLNVSAATERVLALEPDLLGVSSTSFCFPSGVRLIKAVKSARPGTVGLMGGYHPTMFDALMLKEVPELDMILRGEADESLPELVRRIKGGEAVHGAPGLSYRVNGDVVRGIPQQVEDLDSLPFPDRAALNYPGYFYQFGGFYLPEIPPTATVVSSRSCPHRCTFCPKMFPEWRYRMRSAENIFQEVLELQAQGNRIVFFQDENFSHSKKRVEQFCTMILDHKVSMRFGFQGTISHLPDNVLQLMHKAGFDFLFVGVETGSDAQLQRYRKPTTSAVLRQGIRRAKKAHMLVIGFFIHGGPGETLEENAATQKFVREARPHVCGASELSVQPGSVLWEELLRDGEPANLQASYPQRISAFPGQHTETDVRIRRRRFQRAMALSWRHWSRLIEIVDLLIYNRSLQMILKPLLKDYKSIVQLFKGGPKGRDDPRWNTTSSKN